MHNLPPHLSYVSALPNITQKPKYGIDELKQRLVDTWDRISQGIINVASSLKSRLKTRLIYLTHIRQ